MTQLTFYSTIAIVAICRECVAFSLANVREWRPRYIRTESSRRTTDSLTRQFS